MAIARVTRALRFAIGLLAAALPTLILAQAATSTAISSSSNPSTLGDFVTFTATVTGSSPTGRVVFRNGTQIIGAAYLAGGTGSALLSNVALGSNSITAQYEGDTGNLGSTSTPLVQTVNPMAAGTRPYLLGHLNLAPQAQFFISISDLAGSNRFFSANSGSGLELWKTDGTAAGTGLVKDINPGTGSSGAGSTNAVLGSILITVANDGTHGYEIWRSDGTPAGTQLLADICPGACSSALQTDAFVVAGGVAFFFANDGVHGNELWKTDGTAAGTVMVKDINPGAASSLPMDPEQRIPASTMGVLNGIVYFAANDGVNGAELWKSDGTAAGTVMVKDMTPGPGSTPFIGFSTGVKAGGKLYFQVLDPAALLQTLWSTDGTDAGTMAVKSFDGFADESFFDLVEAKGSVLNPTGLALFSSHDSVNGGALWKTDGTPAGTVMLASDPSLAFGVPSSLANLDGTVYFAWQDATNGAELWKSDGTPGGTMVAQDIAPGAGSSSPQRIRVADGKLWFFASDGTVSNQLFRSDGSPTGAQLVKVINPTGSAIPSSGAGVVSTPNGVVLVADDGANRAQLWRTDGTSAGTFMLPRASFGTITAVSSAAFTAPSLVVGERLFFVATDTLHGNEPWTSDATAAGTISLGDLRPGTQASSITELTAVKGQVLNPSGILMFRANNGSGNELWRSDGTLAGTTIIDVNSDPSGSEPSSLVNIDGTLYFTAYGGASGFEVWKSDGTQAGTTMVKDITPAADFSQATNLTNVNGTLYFSYADSANGNQLWKSDGTDPGTVLVKNVVPGPASAMPGNFTAVGSTLFFTIDDGVNGNELWKSDGTGPGTVIVKNINATGSSSPSNLINVGGTLFFLADDGVNGRELWKSDGSGPGTVMVKDLAPGAASSVLGNFTRAGSVLIFTRVTGEDQSGPLEATQIWRSDGTAAGTTMLRDYCSGNPACFASVRSTFEHSGYVFFMASDDLDSKLWRTDGTVVGTVPISSLVASRVLGANSLGVFVSRSSAAFRAEPWYFRFDTTPNPFAFTSVNQTPSTQVISNAVAVTGIDIRVPVSIDFGEFSIGCTATFVTSGTIGPNETICVRHTTAAAPATPLTSTLTIGGVTGTFTSTSGTPALVTSANSVTFTVTAPGTFTVTASGVPTPALGISGALPSGVTFTAASGVLAGTPALGTVGSYPLTLTATNGILSPGNQSFTLVVQKASQAIVFAPLADRPPGSPPFQVTGTGGASGNPVVFSTPDLLVCGTTGVNGTTVVIFAPGICTINANQAGDANYNAAPQVSRSFHMTNLQAITFAAPADRILGAPNFTLTATGGGSGNPVIFSTSTPSVCLLGGVNGATVVLLATGACTVSANQAGSSDYSAAPTVTHTFQVLPANSTLTVVRSGSLATSGTVTSVPSGITCGATCSASFTSLSTVTLNASVGAGANFSGWTGACTGAGTCNVTMNGAKTVKAHFDPPSTPQSADVAITQAASPDPASAGKDVMFTLTVTNHGPAAATSVTLTNVIPSGSSHVWSSAGCVLATGTVTCGIGNLANGASVVRKLVVRPASAGDITNEATVAAAEPEPDSVNNETALTVTVNATPAGSSTQRYRLYSPVTLEHHFTTDLNEYTVLGSYVGTWVQEGGVGKVLDNPGSFNSVVATPYYRLYNTDTRWHHWTTDANEYYTLIEFPGWIGEGVDGYLLPSATAGAIQLYRLNYPALGSLHHWTIDANEYSTLISSFGWIGEGGSGFVIQ